MSDIWGYLAMAAAFVSAFVASFIAGRSSQKAKQAEYEAKTKEFAHDVEKTIDALDSASKRGLADEWVRSKR